MSITAIAITAIICWAIVEIIGKRKEDKRTNAKEREHLDTMNQQIAQLKERVQVLEKIITDQNYDLKREFDNLKDD